ncbi:pentapeptide repeat-containing protein [Microbacterium sp. CGR1]|uniref:pentapeptide repeat-containing protein n=1 Tax=Microbacterium sp. CGR1 TaxID=1696072 RepID=UPI003DA49124
MRLRGLRLRDACLGGLCLLGLNLSGLGSCGLSCRSLRSSGLRGRCPGRSGLRGRGTSGGLRCSALLGGSLRRSGLRGRRLRRSSLRGRRLRRSSLRRSSLRGSSLRRSRLRGSRLRRRRARCGRLRRSAASTRGACRILCCSRARSRRRSLVRRGETRGRRSSASIDLQRRLDHHLDRRGGLVGSRLRGRSGARRLLGRRLPSRRRLGGRGRGVGHLIGAVVGGSSHRPTVSTGAHFLRVAATIGPRNHRSARVGHRCGRI